METKIRIENTGSWHLGVVIIFDGEKIIYEEEDRKEQTIETYEYTLEEFIRIFNDKTPYNEAVKEAQKRLNK